MTRKRPYMARGRVAVLSLGLIVLGASLGLLGRPSHVLAQDAPEGRIVSVREGDRVPFAGTLMDPQVPVWMRGQIDELHLDVARLEAELARTVAREGERSSVLIEVEQARTRAVESRLELRETLWRGRVTELVRELRTARDDARPSFWEQPGLWYGLGVGTVVLVIAGVAVIAGML